MLLRLTLKRSAVKTAPVKVDTIITDPPYYDAIPYSVLMDFFYVWLRRSSTDQAKKLTLFLILSLSPKWDDTEEDGELVDDAARFGGDRAKSKAAYEAGMARSFIASFNSLTARQGD